MSHPLLLFVGIAYALSIALSAAVGATGGSESPLAFGSGVASMFVPTVSVLVVVLLTGAKPSRGWSRFPFRYLPVALLLMPVVMHAVMLPVADTVWGELRRASWLTPEPDGLYHTPATRGWGVLTPAALVARMATNLIVGLAANSTLALFEEVGWRGWMLPRLMELMSVRRAVTVSAVIWAFWHAPFAIGGIHHLPGIPVFLIVLVLPILVIGAGLVIGWLWVRTESLWLAALAHGALNNWGQYAFKFMANEGPGGGDPRDMIVLAAGGLAVLAAGILLITYGLASRSGPRDRPPSGFMRPCSPEDNGRSGSPRGD